MQEQFQVALPATTIESLKGEFNISDNEVQTLLTSIIKKAIAERVGTNDSDVFTQEECKELEEDLKGLGYI